MSTPRSTAMPPGTTPARIPTPGGDLAVLVARAVDQPAGRPHRPDDQSLQLLPAVLVPGFTGSKEDFLALVAPLAASGRTVVAIDQRGQHESPGSDERDAYGLQVLARDVHEVVDWLGGRAHVVGHSFGGFVTRELAAMPAASESVASHTLIGSGPGMITGTRPTSELMMLLDALPVHEMTTIFDAKQAYERGLGVVAAADDVEEFLRARFIGTDPMQLIAAAEHLRDELDRTEVLRRSAVPLLVVSGETEDVWSPEALRTMAEAVGARFVLVEGAGHSPAVDAPGVTAAALLGFWAEVERSR